MAAAPRINPQSTVLPPSYFTRGVAIRLFLTCWVIYCAHFSPFIVRELYLTLSLAERGTVHVDEYMGLHSDLFAMPERGTFMGGNPGAALLAYAPYKLLLPLVKRVAPVRPVAPGEKVSAEYNETRTNKLAFYRRVRERGLDLRLGVAAIISQVLCMAPLSAAGAVVMFALLGRLGFSRGPGILLALLYALGTPIFFRSGTLSLNLIVTLAGLFAFAALWWPAETRPAGIRWRLAAAGFLAGYGVLTDYSGAVTAAVLGIFALDRLLESQRFWRAAGTSLLYLAGAALPVLFLLYWQWYCYGNAWLPVQFHQPAEVYRGYASQRGFTWPQPSALWALLFDPLFGLLVFAPILTLGLYHPALMREETNRVPRRVAAFALAYSAALWIFSACIEYTLRHQWQDGVRYMAPAVPFLFLLMADVMSRMPRWVAVLAGAAALVESFCLSMVRESPLESLTRVFTHGIEFPWLTALSRTAAQYYPPLAEHSAPVAWGAFAFTAVVVTLIWVAGPKERSA